MILCILENENLFLFLRDLYIVECDVYGSPIVHHLFNKKGSLMGTKSLVHFFKGGGL